jgi:Zn-finger nucleic acid-binding protein
MNCPNCGAAMELIESRRYFVCRHCGSFSFPEPIDVDGIRIVGRTPDARNCPICAVPMDQALLDDRVSVHFCGKCRGLLLPRDTFAGIVTQRRAWASGPGVQPPPLDRRALDRQLGCPLCGRPFQTYAYGGPGAVVIDACEHCNVLWLDYRELKQIVDAPGSDRGSRETVVRDDDYAIVPRPTEEDLVGRADPLDFLLTLLS